MLAERVGFEPTVRFPVRSLSRRVLSTAQSPLRSYGNFNRSNCFGFEQSRVPKLPKPTTVLTVVGRIRPKASKTESLCAIKRCARGRLTPLWD
jgi:hypothetical protein